MPKFFCHFFSTGLLMLSILSATAQPGTSPKTKKADSLYYAQDWKAAKAAYKAVLNDTSVNNISWNRLGFLNYNTGSYTDALYDYKKALANHPIVPVKASAYSRMARVNALQ